MSLGKVLGVVVSAVVGYLIGSFIVNRIPPLAAIVQPRAQG